MNRLLKSLTAACLAATLSSQASASIIIGGTRVVYPEGTREVSLQLNNNGDSPSLVQSWVDSGNANSTPEDADAPFVLTPPIARVNAEGGQALRIAFTGDKTKLPRDHESLFWLNVLDIPPEPAIEGTNKNFIQLAFRSRIKVFYRPAGLTSSPAEAADKVRWVANGNKITAENDSPYHVSMTNASAISGQQSGDVVEHGYMLTPGEHKSFELDKNITFKPVQISYTYINDFGGRVQRTVDLNK